MLLFLLCLFSSVLAVSTQVQQTGEAHIFQALQSPDVCPIDWNVVNLSHAVSLPSVGPFNGCGGCINVTDVPLTRHTYALTVARSPSSVIELGLGAFEDLFGPSAIGTQRTIAWSITGQSFCSNLLPSPPLSPINPGQL
ncbi:hypothetical protein CLU79DRAFT_752275 [Phycomyces nitens]|nr:hypothetical protein CLU79DRAFT_752275 [Phycomyces nitens]